MKRTKQNAGQPTYQHIIYRQIQLSGLYVCPTCNYRQSFGLTGQADYRFKSQGNCTPWHRYGSTNHHHLAMATWFECHTVTNYHLTCSDDACLLLNILNATALQTLPWFKTGDEQMLSYLSPGGQPKEHGMGDLMDSDCRPSLCN